jgi:exopolysaccharide production protein ExoQ
MSSAKTCTLFAISIFALLVQQGAFVSMPLYINDSFLPVREEQNDLNTFAILISFAAVFATCVFRSREMWLLIRENGLSVSFVVLVLVSSTWSVHPDISLRRGVGYVLSLLVAAYLTIIFRLEQRMKLLSIAFAVAAVATVVFVVAYPDYGVMRFMELKGNWRGVFPHKNTLGLVMAAAVFVETYILASGDRIVWWRLGLLSTYCLLVIQSRSATALILVLLYLTGALLYVFWRYNRMLSLTFSFCALLVLFASALVLYLEPGYILGLIGKDVSLTGRTEVWDVVVSLIEQKPLLGWGYRATWVLGDAATVLADRQVGGWGLASSHNAFLEIALQLGAVGAISITLIIVCAFWRAVECLNVVPGPFGWFCILFYVGTLVSAQTEVTLGQNQEIDWLLFNVLLLGSSRGRIVNDFPRTTLPRSSALLRAA